MKQSGKTIRDYVYSSEIKARDKFSLKNLISEDLGGLQRNYVSQQTQRVSRPVIRPQTMYGDRVKLVLHQQDKRQKLQTQLRKRRSQGSFKIVKSSSGVQVRTISQDQKIKMKRALGKINLLAQGNILQINEQQQIEAIFNFIGCLAEVNNHYQIAFQYLGRKLRELVFAKGGSEIFGDVKQLADRTKNQYLVNFVYRNLGKTTYKNLSRQLLKQTKIAVSQMQFTTQKQVSDEQKYQQIIRQKQQIIKKLKRQLKYYQEHPSQDLYPYVKKLERENKQMKDQVSELLYIRGENEYSIQIYETTNLLLSEQVEKLKAKIYEQEIQEVSNQKKIEKSSEMVQFELNIQTLKEMLDKSKLKMQGMKEEFDKLKAQNQHLINERSLLAKRAAIGFGELTPRPNVKSIFSENNLDYQKYVALSKKNSSTENILRALVDKLKLYSIQKPQIVIQKVKIVHLDEEDEQNQDFQNAIDYIDKTKDQIYKTIESVEEVKKAFNRQQSQKQKLQGPKK